MANKITYAKLKSGNWGVRVVGTDKLSAGDTVRVTKASGEVKEEQNERLVWSRDDVALWSVEERANRPARRADISIPRNYRPGGTRTGCSCGSVQEYSKPSDCWTCKHDAD